MLPTDYAKLRPHLNLVDLPQGELLIECDELIKTCYFFEGGLGSVLAITEAGQAVEMGLYGLDGFGGIPILLRAGQSPHRLTMQIGGSGYRLPTEVLLGALRTSEQMTEVLLNYVQFFLIQTAQTCLSNALHPFTKRLARWLLMSHDRMDDDDVPLTHEYLAIMLGATRATVTTTLGEVADLGLIATRRGTIRVADRSGLEHLAGDAYGVPEREFERLIGFSVRKQPLAS